MNVFLATLISLASIGGGMGLCFYLLHRLQNESTAVWYLEHVFCPLMRVLVLLVVASQVYPVIDGQSSSLDLWRNLARGQQLRDLINILFVAGLLMAFVPLLNHPLIALPAQSLLTIALAARWQYLDSAAQLELLPSMAVTLKLSACTAVTWFVTRTASIPMSRWVDRAFHVRGSVRLVADAIYLLLQIPLMLIYCDYLARQLS